MEAKGKEVVKDSCQASEITSKAANVGLSSSIAKNKNTHPRVRPINNQRPLNHEYAGKIYPLESLPKKLRQKYPHSVPFTGTGHPDFSRYTIKKVDINMTGKRRTDNALANQAAGFPETPLGYTWHHHENGKTMLLVPRDLHNAVAHTGGVAIMKNKGNKNGK
jgi:hypothetical protein